MIKNIFSANTKYDVLSGLKASNLVVLIILSLSFYSCKEEIPVKQFSKIEGMVLIPAGTLIMGGNNEQASEDEFPKHNVEINAFYMDETEVTNREFKKFVEATGYITVAERELDWELLKKDLPPNVPKPPDSLFQPGALVFHPTSTPVSFEDPSKWWFWTIGASWKNPEGPNSDIADKMDHPVVQVSWEDAKAYADWAGKRLPSEAEWEWAARGGKKESIYPWGNELVDNSGVSKANYWQGMFPYKNTIDDGFMNTAPVKSFPANDYGLYDMAGNVWEWCEDWYDYNYYNKENASKAGNSGPARSFNPNNQYTQSKVLRGGSFLCNDDYCSGYRNARRMQSSPDTGLNHTGFRCVKSAL